jgi:hypothetical protein
MENVWLVVFWKQFFDSDSEWLILVKTLLSYDLNPTTPEPL